MKIEYIRSKRRTLSLQIAKDGTVKVKIPTWLPKAKADAFVTSKMPWIVKNTNKLLAMQKAAVPFSDEEKNEFLRTVKEEVGKRVEYYADRMGVSYQTIRIKYLKSKWGSCKNDGSLTFNALLGAVPSDVLDYVIVHELAHRKEMNHSMRFYAEIEKILPHYKIPQKWLKNNGRILMMRAFPESEEREIT